jgi:hypothetical protein
LAQRKQYLLRIDPDLWSEVERWAADELRSVNAQVEYVLRDAIKRRRGPTSSPAAEIATPEATEEAPPEA